jgi:hypothetical protein
VATRQRSNITTRSPPSFKRTDQALVVLETRFTVQNGDGWIAVQDAFVLGVPQFIDAGLLGQQLAAVNRGGAAIPPSNGLSGADGRCGRRGS